MFEDKRLTLRAAALIAAITSASCLPAKSDSILSEPTVAVIKVVLKDVHEREFADGILPIDARIVRADSVGGMLPPGSKEHAGMAPSALLVNIAKTLSGVRVVQPSQWSSEAKVVTLAEPHIRSDIAVVFLAIAEPRGPWTATYWLYQLERSGSQSWRVVKRQYLSVEG